MIERLTPPPPRVSLFEAVLARWLVEMAGVQYELDDFRSHVRLPSAAGAPVADAPAAEEPSTAPDAGPESVGDTDVLHSDPDSDHGLEVDDRFPGLGRFGRLLEVGAGHLEAARAAYAVQGRQAAVQARQLAAFAAARPAALLDLPDDEVGSAAAASRGARPAVLTEVSEWAVDEVMAAFALTSRAASGLLADSITLAERLPATLDALEAGLISWAHARMLAEVVGPVNDVVRAGVEARLLARAAGKTVPQLRQAAHRAVLHADAAAAAKRLARAIRDRGVHLYPGKDGMAAVASTMSLPVAAACHKALAAYAESCRTPGDERTLDQRMADCFADLILRPGVNGPVQIGLTLVAGVNTMTGGDEPAELGGHSIPAELARQLAYVLGLHSRPDTDGDDADGADTSDAVDPADPRPAASQDPVSGNGTHQDEPHQDGTRQDGTHKDHQDEEAEPGATASFAAFRPAPDDVEEPAAGLGELLRLRTTTGTALAHLPRIAVVEELTGQLLALTDAAGLRAAATCSRPGCRAGRNPCSHPPTGPALGPPPDSPGYRPSAALDRFVRARDRRCRFPGCRAAAIRCDLDHNQPWPAGATSADNLCCLCRHHHRLSHQAPGWTMTRLPDGGLQWTTPGGQTITTHPLRYGSDDDLPAPPRPPEDAVAATVTPPIGNPEQLRRWPPPSPDPDEDPAPF